jgi:hypothetical protein
MRHARGPSRRSPRRPTARHSPKATHTARSTSLAFRALSPNSNRPRRPSCPCQDCPSGSNHVPRVRRLRSEHGRSISNSPVAPARPWTGSRTREGSSRVTFSRGGDGARRSAHDISRPQRAAAARAPAPPRSKLTGAAGDVVLRSRCDRQPEMGKRVHPVPEIRPLSGGASTRSRDESRYACPPLSPSPSETTWTCSSSGHVLTGLYPFLFTRSNHE